MSTSTARRWAAPPIKGRVQEACLAGSGSTPCAESGGWTAFPPTLCRNSCGLDRDRHEPCCPPPRPPWESRTMSSLSRTQTIRPDGPNTTSRRSLSACPTSDVVSSIQRNAVRPSVSMVRHGGPTNAVGDQHAPTATGVRNRGHQHGLSSDSFQRNAGLPDESIRIRRVDHNGHTRIGTELACAHGQTGHPVFGKFIAARRHCVGRTNIGFTLSSSPKNGIGSCHVAHRSNSARPARSDPVNPTARTTALMSSRPSSPRPDLPAGLQPLRHQTARGYRRHTRRSVLPACPWQRAFPF